MKIILASASPRRRELLSGIVKNFEIIPAKGEECADDSLPPELVARQLAENKCGEVFENNKGSLVIACDTIVVYSGVILGKPKSAEDAIATLKMLSGKTHSVITGVCMRCGNKKITASEKTEVRFNDLSEDFIKAYVAGGSPMDKAGSYGIQDGGIVQEYFGSYTNVVGLPVTLTKKLLDGVRIDK